MKVLPASNDRKRIPVRLLKLLVGLYLLACVYLYFRQAHLIFLPTTEIESTPDAYGCKYEEVTISGEGYSLYGWYLQAYDAEAARQAFGKTLIYFHGNADSIGGNAEHSCRLSKYGFNVLVVDYRGFGKSVVGPPTEKKAYADAESVYQYVLSQKHVTPDHLIIYGHSLGGAIAIELATHHPEASGLIAESTFTSVVEEAATEPQYRIFPLRLLVHEKFDSLSKVPTLKMPVLFIHGDLDEVIPKEMGEKNFAAAPEPKAMVIIHGGHHVNCASVEPEKYKNAVMEFLARGMTAAAQKTK